MFAYNKKLYICPQLLTKTTMTNLHFFKRPGRPVYMMIDSNPERPHMTTITAKDGYNSVAHCDDGAHVKRMLQSTTDGRDIEVISFDEYFRISANVDAVVNNNYTELFNLYFDL